MSDWSALSTGITLELYTNPMNTPSSIDYYCSTVPIGGERDNEKDPISFRIWTSLPFSGNRDAFQLFDSFIISVDASRLLNPHSQLLIRPCLISPLMQA